jgi:hypothetical protein
MNSFLLLIMLLPLSARFALEVPVFLLFNVLVITGTLFNRLVLRFRQEVLHTYATIFFVFFATILFKQLLTLFSPVLAMVLDLPFYVVLFCAVEVGRLLDLDGFRTLPLKTLVLEKSKASLKFSLTALAVALLRELLAYHSVSLPSPSGMVELPFFTTAGHPFSVFWASIPGCLVLFALLFAAKSFVMRNILRLAAHPLEVPHV